MASATSGKVRPRAVRHCPHCGTTIPSPWQGRKTVTVGVIVLLLVAGLAGGRLLALRDVQSVLPPPEKTWRNTIGTEFVLIVAGEFLMGSESGSSDEKPAHWVRISKNFYLGKYEVTQAQWQAVMGDNPSRFKGDTLPVEQVSWEDAQKFIERLNVKDGGPKYRLPTEAEWEYAARAGTTTTYSFGDDSHQLGEYAWFSVNSGIRTNPVGQKKPNKWGLYDMYGNVWEWVHDWDSAYAYEAFTSTAVDPKGPSAGSLRVTRGGSWLSGTGDIQSSLRSYSRPGDRRSDFGFRLLREVP